MSKLTKITFVLIFGLIAVIKAVLQNCVLLIQNCVCWLAAHIAKYI